MKPNINYYEILGIKPNASKQEIKAAYKKMVKQHHPDANFGQSAQHLELCENKMKQLNEAYKVLSNDQLRQQYDCTLQQQSAPQYNYQTYKNYPSEHYIDLWKLFQEELQTFIYENTRPASWEDYAYELRVIEYEIEDVIDQIEETRWQIAILEENYAGYPGFRARRAEMLQHLGYLKRRLRELKIIRLELIEEMEECNFFEDDEY